MNKKLLSATIFGLFSALLMVNAPVNAQDKMSNTSKMSSSVLVTTGKFRMVTHKTSGTATIFEKPDGTRELKLENFATADGPALHVFLVAAGDARDNASVKKSGFLDLGKLKMRKGVQTYAVPANIDLWKYRAVTIWCDKFSVNFGTAPLAAKQ
ncbi:MAG: DM13 domain-containing protein [Capsulimonadales bacterium]|nr:DM13 domain-containing protein [Capsulimonadales bacterium]